ncbi:ABC transporter ATP-binding protein/permease [Paenibacillus sp. CAU 1782]
MSTQEQSSKSKKRSKMMDMRLLGLVEHSRKYIALGVLVNWIGLISNICAILTIGLMLQKAWDGEASRSFSLIGAGVVALAMLIRLLCSYGGSLLSWRASVNAKRTLRSRIYSKLLKLGGGYSEKTSTSEVVQVAVEGVEQLEHYFGRYMPQFFYSLLAPMTLFSVLSFVSVKAVVILLLCVPLIPMSIIAIMRFAKKLFSQYWGSYVNLGESFLENLQGLSTLKIYNADQLRHEEMNNAAEKFRKITMKVLTMQLNSVTIMDVVAFGGAGAGVIIAAYQFSAGEIPLWGAFAIILLSAEFFIPLRLLGSYFHIAMNGMAASDKIFRLLELEEEAGGNQPYRHGDIVYRNVHYAYGPEKTALRNISMSLPAVGMVGLVGESGSGKSTIAALLAGINSGYEGGISIAGTELSALSHKSLRRNITLIGHNSYIFRGTVGENLRMAAPDASDQELLQALEQVNLREFVMGQGGLSCKLDEQGGNWSGGQRQRLALARALLHDSSIYIFDEATSNIDVESEQDIMGVISSLAKSKTVVLISHRLANVVSADRIYVLNHGEVVEQGKSDDLLRQGGHYAALYHGQRQVEQYAKGETAYA